jgi:hypothetical protein
LLICLCLCACAYLSCRSSAPKKNRPPKPAKQPSFLQRQLSKRSSSRYLNQIDEDDKSAGVTSTTSSDHSSNHSNRHDDDDDHRHHHHHPHRGRGHHDKTATPPPPPVPSTSAVEIELHGGGHQHVRPAVPTVPPPPPDVYAGGWEACTDPHSGESYYWNRTTNETTWDPPTAHPRHDALLNASESLALAGSTASEVMQTTGYLKHVREHAKGQLFATRPDAVHLSLRGCAQPMDSTSKQPGAPLTDKRGNFV